MIRLNKPVKLLEWGEGTNTLNQIWTEIGEGKIIHEKTKDGITKLSVEITGSFNKKNQKDNSIKIVQPGEGMTSCSDSWGEVAIGQLNKVEPKGGKSLVVIDISTAVKMSN